MIGRTYTLIDAKGMAYSSDRKGTLGGHRKLRLYGRLDCPSALRYVAAGTYAKFRVFFADESTAIAAGYRPCARCMPREHTRWKVSRND
jgi:methylphosphotriester-DNA--protein-cysteine methyltransferase